MAGARSQGAGPLDGHVRRGRRFLPSLAATDVLQLTDWARDDLPDLLWPALLLSHEGNGAALRLVRWQAAVQEDLRDTVEATTLARCLDGSLSGLDALAARHPESIAIVERRTADCELLPELVVSALATFPERPATWFIPHEERAPTSDDLNFLANALVQAFGDGHREALLKCLSIWSAVQAGTFAADAQFIDLLRDYPNDPATRDQADCVVRASWLAAKIQPQADPRRDEARIRWARVFWVINSTTKCIRRRDVDATADEDIGDTPDADDEHESEPDRLQKVAQDLVSSYVEALETSPTDLYDPTPQEVHAGLVGRAGREVITALSYPDLWCIENGSHVIRVLIETRIYLEWMATQDRTVYRRYQEFGFGKAKLYAEIFDEHPVEARIDGFNEAIEELSRLSHNDLAVDYRIVDTSDSFSGKSIRAMAQECGLLDLYRHGYYIASGVAHSEWWSVETHAMERCLNPLHRGHLIPSLSLTTGTNLPLARSWLDQLYTLMWNSLILLGTDRDAVTAAFAWLEDSEFEQQDCARP